MEWTHGTYLIEVQNWSLPYSFGLSWQEDRDDPFSEYDCIEIEGIAVEPKMKLPVQILIWPVRELATADRSKFKPTSVGFFSGSREKIGVHLHIPADRYAPVVTALAASKVGCISLSAPKLRYGSASIRTFSLWPNLDQQRVDEVRSHWKEVARRARVAGKQKPKGEKGNAAP